MYFNATNKAKVRQENITSSGRNAIRVWLLTVVLLDRVLKNVLVKFGKMGLVKLNTTMALCLTRWSRSSHQVHYSSSGDHDEAQRQTPIKLLQLFLWISPFVIFRSRIPAHTGGKKKKKNLVYDAHTPSN